MMMKKLIALLVCILLLATAQAEAPPQHVRRRNDGIRLGAENWKNRREGNADSRPAEHAGGAGLPGSVRCRRLDGIHGRCAVGIRRVCDALVPRRGAHYAQYRAG